MACDSERLFRPGQGKQLSGKGAAKFRIALLQADLGGHGVIVQNRLRPVGKHGGYVRGRQIMIFIVIDKEYIVRGQCKTVEKLFIQQSTADNFKSMAFQQPGQITEQGRTRGNNR